MIVKYMKLLKEFILLEVAPFIVPFNKRTILGGTAGSGDSLDSSAKPKFSDFTLLKNIGHENSWNESDVNEIFKMFYKQKSYAPLKGQDNVYIVMDSTSNKNMLGILLAKRLKQDFGGQILWDVFRTKASKQTKQKNTPKSRIEDSVSVSIVRDLSPEINSLKEKNIVLVDDSINAGETFSAARRSLWNNFKIKVAYGAVLTGMSGHTPSTEKDLTRLTNKIVTACTEAGIPSDYDSVEKIVNNLFKGETSYWVNLWDKEFDRLMKRPSKKSIQSLIDLMIQTKGIKEDLPEDEPQQDAKTISSKQTKQSNDDSSSKEILKIPPERHDTLKTSKIAKNPIEKPSEEINSIFQKYKR